MNTAAGLGTWDVFIAATPGDEDLARAFWEGLRALGLRPFLLSANVVHAEGINLEPMFSQALRDSELLLVLVTPKLNWSSILPLWSQVGPRCRASNRPRVVCVYTAPQLMQNAPYPELRRHAVPLGDMQRRAELYRRIYACRHPAPVARPAQRSNERWLGLSAVVVIALLALAIALFK